MLTRAEALAELIRRVEAGEWPDASEIVLTFWGAGGNDALSLFTGCRDAFNGSLDAVARLEAPLRERDWSGPLIHPPEAEDPCWEALWVSEHNQEVEARAYSEAPARLLAVLRALHQEATQ